jgi:cold shock CspA family protein
MDKGAAGMTGTIKKMIRQKGSVYQYRRRSDEVFFHRKASRRAPVRGLQRGRPRSSSSQEGDKGPVAFDLCCVRLVRPRRVIGGIPCESVTRGAMLLFPSPFPAFRKIFRIYLRRPDPDHAVQRARGPGGGGRRLFQEIQPDVKPLIMSAPPQRGGPSCLRQRNLVSGRRG